MTVSVKGLWKARAMKRSVVRMAPSDCRVLDAKDMVTSTGRAANGRAADAMKAAPRKKHAQREQWIAISPAWAERSH